MDLTSSSLPWFDALDQRALRAWVTLKSKRPNTPAFALERSELLDSALAHARVLWLNAPAGYGKTVLMADVARAFEQQRRVHAVIWLSLDSKDAPDSLFLRHFLEAAERAVPGTASDALAHWESTRQRGEIDVGGVLLLWLTSMQQSSKQLLLCFDDVHALNNESSWHLLNLLIEQLPINITLLLSSRFVPSQAGRLRLNPNVSWFDERQLAFSDDDVQQLLIMHNVAQPGKWIGQLGLRIQGWPAGIALWLNCYRAAGRPLEPAPHFAQEEMADYLSGEVLYRLPAELRAFLQRVAVLGAFNEALLQHCFEADTYHSALQQALQLNVFVRASTQHPGWYRVHPVMAELLAHQMPLSQRLSWHRRAYDWLSEHQYPVAALQQAVRGQLGQEVVAWVEQEAEMILASLDIAGLIQWLQQAGDALIHSSPRLMQIAAWAWLLTLQMDRAKPLIDRLQQGGLASYELTALRGYAARLQGQLSVAEQLCQLALDQLPAARFSLRILMSSTLAHLRLAQNDADGARLWNRLGQDLARQYRVSAMEALVLYDYARIEFHRGHLTHSHNVVDRALVLLPQQEGQTERLPKGRLLLYHAFLLWLKGHKRDVDECLRQGIAIALQARDISACYGYAITALRHTQQGQYSFALDVLDHAERLMQRWQVDSSQYHWLLLVKANVFISQTKFSRAQQCLDELRNQYAQQQLPTPEVFPLLPGFTLITQARLHLMGKQADACLQLIERQGTQQGIVGLLLMFLRAAALHSQQKPEGPVLLAKVKQLMEREGIQFDVDAWLPLLAEGQMPALTEELAIAGKLSERELDVLRKIAQGLSNQEVADQLFISLHTVKTHARKINIKLAAKNRTQALRRAQELGLI
ncbi:MAG: hypothetical protein IBX52_02745 [Bacterioplanes sp.]|nr:hypothetical protein [Bacterioplanes sp.]